MRLPPPPPLPSEHGAWTMLAIPMVLGLFAGGFRSLPAWLICGAVVLAFLAHYAIVPWAARTPEAMPCRPASAPRRILWAAGYLAASGALFAAAVRAAEPEARVEVLGIAGVASCLASIFAAACIRGSGRILLAESLGLVGMSLTAPMMLRATGQPLTPRLFGISAISLAYFFSSIAYVRAYGGLSADRARSIGGCVLAHVAILLGLALATTSGIVAAYAWAAMVPPIARTAWGLASPPATLRSVGMRELAVALAFTALAAAGILAALGAA